MVSLLRRRESQQTRSRRRVRRLLQRDAKSARFVMLLNRAKSMFVSVNDVRMCDCHADGDRSVAIDRVIYLQRYEEGWRNGKWETRADERPCIDRTQFVQVR